MKLAEFRNKVHSRKEKAAELAAWKTLLELFSFRKKETRISLLDTKKGLKTTTTFQP